MQPHSQRQKYVWPSEKHPEEQRPNVVLEWFSSTFILWKFSSLPQEVEPTIAVNTSGKQTALAPRGAVFTSARAGRPSTASHKEPRHRDSECMAQAAGVIAGEPWKKMYAAALRLIRQTAKLNAAWTTAASDHGGHGGSSLPWARKPNGIERFLHLEPPKWGLNPSRERTHNESCSSVVHWPGMGCTHMLIHRHKAPTPPPHVPVAPEPGHLAQGSKAVCRSNQSSQWVTPLIQFYFISGEQTTRGVCTFLGSRSNPISQWPEIRL